MTKETFTSEGKKIFSSEEVMDLYYRAKKAAYGMYYGIGVRAEDIASEVVASVIEKGKYGKLKFHVQQAHEKICGRKGRANGSELSHAKKLLPRHATANRDGELTAEFIAAMKTFSREERLILYLIHQQGFTTEDLARIMHTSPEEEKRRFDDIFRYRKIEV